MKNTVTLLVAFIVLLFAQDCFSQKKINISTPELQLLDNKVIILYDIEGQSSNETFTVWIEITDIDGGRIQAKSLSGDIGNRISGGKGKKITWNYEADQIILEEGIYVQVFADPDQPPTPTDIAAETVEDIQQVNTGKIVAQSLLFPGLGLSRETGKPHWIRGAMGYGCVGSAIVLNQMAENNYDLYLDEDDPLERDKYYETALRQDNISEVLAYAAIGIWVADVIWNFVGSSKLNSTGLSYQKRFSVQPLYEPVAQAPMLALRVRF